MRESFARRVLPTINSGTDPVAEARACLQLMAKHLLDCLQAEIKSDRYVLLDWPNYTNIGDRLIHVAELYVLAKYCGARCVYSAHKDNFNADALRKVGRAVPVLFNGGGNLGDLWPQHQEFRERVIRQFPKRRFIILPQSMHYGDPAALERTSRLFRAHANLTIFLRDWRSFELAAEHFGAERVRLAPDMVIALIELMPRLLAAHGPAVHAVLHLLRDDKERSGNRPPTPDGAQVSDWVSLQPGWNEKEVSVPGASRLASAAGMADALNVPGGRKSWLYFVLGLRQILKAERVVTDRLHAHVLSMLAGRPNVLHANDYHKNRAFYETWMDGLSLCEFEA